MSGRQASRRPRRWTSSWVRSLRVACAARCSRCCPRRVQRRAAELCEDGGYDVAPCAASIRRERRRSVVAGGVNGIHRVSAYAARRCSEGGVKPAHANEACRACRTVRRGAPRECRLLRAGGRRSPRQGAARRCARWFAPGSRGRDSRGSLPGSPEGALPSVGSGGFWSQEGGSRRPPHGAGGGREEQRPGSRSACAAKTSRSSIETSRSSIEPVRGGAERRAARAVPLVGRRHPARVDRQQRLQDLHLRPAVPEAAVGPLRGRGAEAHRRRCLRHGGVDRSGRAPVLRAGPGAVGYDPEDGHQHRRGAEQGVRRTRGTERRAGRRTRRHRLQRRAEARRRKEPRHGACASGAAFLGGLAPQRPHGRARPARPRLRVPDRAVRGRRGQEGR